MKVVEIIDNLYSKNTATEDELLFLLNNISEHEKSLLTERANKTRLKAYGNKVYLRGLIEFTNYCVKNCTYCGIRFDNKKLERYRLTNEQILSCVDLGDKLGYKTFVLQGGEDPYYNDDIMSEILYEVKKRYPNNAITLSLGERSHKSYKRLFQAGADRYLLRHETATKELYEKLHPNSNFENRIRCLYDLKEIGYEVGAGFMVGLPEEKNEDLVKNLIFIKELNPHMCGIGPFIPHKDTPLGKEKGGDLDNTIIMLALARLLLPKVLLPATTALGTIDYLGREKGIKAGANIVMPNLSPIDVRDKYSLYDGKICTGDEAAECRRCIEGRISRIGYEVEIGRGDSLNK